MVPTTQNYKNALRAAARCIRAKLTAGDTTYTDDGALVSLTWERGAGSTEKLFGNAIAAKITAEISGAGANPATGTPLQAFFWPDGLDEVIHSQVFYVDGGEEDKDTNTATVYGHDIMISLEKHLAAEIVVQYPITLGEYAAATVALAGLELADTDWLLADTVLQGPPNLSGSETCRSVLGWIAECAFANATIDRAGKIAIRSILHAGEPTDIDPDLYFEVTLGEPYGPINTLTLARLPQGDNIYRENADDVANRGRVALTIADNPFLDGMREEVIDLLFAKVKGATILPYTLDWCGDPAFDPGDHIVLTDTKGQHYSAFFGAEVLEFDGGLRSSVEVHPINAVSINYKQAAGVKEAIRRTLLEVDKANNRITSLAQQTYTKDQTDGQITSKVEQTAGAIRAEAEDTYTTKDETASLKAALELGINNFKVEFTAEQGKLVDINGDLQGFKELVLSYFEFTPEGMIIGKSDSPFATKYTNEKISFLSNGQEIAYVQYGILYIRNAHFVDGITIGGTTAPGNQWGLQKVPGGFAIVWLG